MQPKENPMIVSEDSLCTCGHYSKDHDYTQWFDVKKNTWMAESTCDITTCPCESFVRDSIVRRAKQFILDQLVKIYSRFIPR